MIPYYLQHLHPKLARTVAPCREWRGAFDKQGYPRTTVKGRSMYAHRHVYWLNWQLKPGQPVYRLCGNRRCVNPYHLSIEKPERKGKRQRPASAKLSPKKVRAIRERWAQPNRPTQQVLADKYGVSRSAISLLLRGLTWTAV